ncbi:hypothetical protein CDIK_0562 [Cucumispora dikerogammari]|nr:hypothetical protein CDIK_0562 [Cucumispora dikerogammari]
MTQRPLHFDTNNDTDVNNNNEKENQPNSNTIRHLNTDTHSNTQNINNNIIDLSFEKDLDSYDKRVLFDKTTFAEDNNEDEDYLKELEDRMSVLKLNNINNNKYNNNNIWEEKSISLLNADIQKEKILNNLLKEILDKMKRLNL